MNRRHFALQVFFFVVAASACVGSPVQEEIAANVAAPTGSVVGPGQTSDASGATGVANATGATGTSGASGASVLAFMDVNQLQLLRR